MTTIAVLTTKLGLDRGEYKKGLKDAASEGKGFASSTGGFLKNALSFATGGAILSGLTSVAGKITDIAGSMISGNGEFERYQTQFGVLLKSSTAAKQRLQELSEFGAKTPFELPELVRADKILTAFGLDSADTAARFGVSGAQIRQTIGDVASGTGTSFEELSTTFGKFASGATGEAISRFQELGIATRQEMAGWGLEFSKTGQLLTPTQEAFTVLEKHVRSKFGGMMDAQSTTFEGMVSNLQDWWGQTTRTLGAPIFEVVKDKLKVVLDFLNKPETQATIKSFAELLANGIGKAMDWLSNTAIPALVDGWHTVEPVLTTVADLIGKIVGGFQKDGLGGAIEAFMPSLSKLTDKAEALLYKFGGWIVNTAAPWLGEQLLSWGKAFIDWVGPQIGPALGKLGDLLDALGRWIRDTAAPWLGEHLGIWAEEFLVWVGPATVKLIIKLGELLGEILKWIVARAPTIAETIGGWILSAAEWFVTKGLPALLGALGTIAVAVGSKIVELWNNAFTTGTLGEALVNAIKNAWLSFEGWFQGKWKEFLAWMNGGNLTPEQQKVRNDYLNNPGRALGGQVFAGQAYTVGELGRETFIPAMNGSIVPAGASGGVMVNVHVAGSVVSERELAQVVREQLLDLKRRNPTAGLA